MRLPEQHRHLFADPIGDLLHEDDVDVNRIVGIVDGVAAVVTVGDRTTEKILTYGITPDIQIVDGMEQRGRRTPPGGKIRTISCANPPAHITGEAVSAIISAYATDVPTRILVSGEEDLLLVPALVHAPDGAVLMYGQPGEGIVVVRADETSRERARLLMSMMEE